MAERNSDVPNDGRYLSLDPNERSGHQARELKSIHVDAPAAVVRLVLHNCYNNKYNAYNQVGLVALIITGETLDEHQLSQIRQRGYSPLLQTPRIQAPSSKVVDAALHGVDSFTAARIHRLQQEKVIAVQDENYDEAKRLKNLIERLKSLGEQIKQLELRKRAAVEVEDYDVAKSCKVEIERLRQCDGNGKESLSYASENPDSFKMGGSSSKHTEVSTSENNYHKILPCEETFRVNHQTQITETSTEDHEGNHCDCTEVDKIADGVDVQAKTTSDPQRVQGDLLKEPSLTNPAGEKRQGMLPTVFSWWKGKEAMQNSDEDSKTITLHPPCVEHYASTSEQKTAIHHPPDVDGYASTSQQTTTVYPPVEQNFTKPDQETATLRHHAESFMQITQQNCTDQPPEQVGRIGYHCVSTQPSLDHSVKSGYHCSTVDYTKDELHKSGQQQISTVHPSVDQYANAGQQNADIRPAVESYCKYGFSTSLCIELSMTGYPISIVHSSY